VGLIRVVLRGEQAGFRLNRVDKLFIAWALVEVLCAAMRGIQGQYLGFAYDALGAYFLVRILVKEPEDVLSPLRFLCMVSLVVAGVMCYEAATHNNPFGVMGGVPMVDELREGKARAQGPFTHPISAGVFGASLFPLAIGLWLQGGGNRRAAVAGVIGCIAIVITSVSSGALMTIMVACIGLCLWRARQRMRLIRRCIVVALIALAVVMKAPVWYVIARVSNVAGGSGWYRSWLIDVCISNFDKWWLAGDSHTLDWAPQVHGTLGDPTNLDLVNYYVTQCALGGIWMLALFIAILTCCFQTVGRLVGSGEESALNPVFVWSLGVGLAAYCTTFLSSSTSTQSGVSWHWLLAVVAGLPVYALSGGTAAASVDGAVSGALPEPAADRETDPRYLPYPS
jgi:hypothetical protein